jgi:hypothetical protein
LRPLRNSSFRPIPVLDSNFNPRNTQCMPACPVGPADRTGVVIFFGCLNLEQKFSFMDGHHLKMV